ncbi:MAG TPA: sigma factor [Phycisphaerae bacterium]|nr:sigma factor [Phycisphaerae bacterium]
MGASLPRDADLPAYARSLIRIKAQKLVRRTGFSRSDEDDVRQELAARLIQQLPKFDPARAALNTFIARVVDSAVKMYLRDRGRQKRGEGRIVQSLDVAVGEDKGRPVTGAELLNEADHARRLGLEAKSETERINQKLTVEGVLANLPPNLRKLCQRLPHETKTAIAQDMGITPRELECFIEMIRQRFRAAGLDEP